jgi:hypothetical protein
VFEKTTTREDIMIRDIDSTDTKTETETNTPLNLMSTGLPTTKSVANTKNANSLIAHKISNRRATVESTIARIKPGYSKANRSFVVPTGAFEIEPDGTILHFRPYDANGISIDELEGLNLFEDVIRNASERDADYFAKSVERGEAYRTSRHLLHGRDLSLILLYHANTHTYWGFLGPA